MSSEEHVLALLEQLADAVQVMHARTLALQRLLVQRGIVTDEEVKALMVAMDEEATEAVELSDNPTHVAWRRLRRLLREEEEPPDDAASTR